MTLRRFLEELFLRTIGGMEKEMDAIFGVLAGEIVLL
jgi:hypothetical protein